MAPAPISIAAERNAWWNAWWNAPGFLPRWSAMLSVRGLTVEIGGTLVVEGAGFTVRAGDRVGLVGRNGAGKTTLLKVLGGMSEPKAGVIQRPEAFGYLPQDPRLDAISPDTSALTHVLGGRGLDELAARMEELRLKMEAQPGDERMVAKWSRAHDAFEHAGGYAAESEARRLLAGLGLRSDRAERPITVLSGGERRRVELARILFAGSELLMLDEPTNHLDNDAREWLLDFLRGYRGALIVISHDLELLDESITRVLHLDRPGEADVGEMTEYKGTYSQYKAAREPRRDPARQDRGSPADRDRPPPDARRPVGRQGQQGGVRQVARDPHRPHPQRGRRGPDGPPWPAAAAARSAAVGPHGIDRARADQELRRRSPGLRRPLLRDRSGRAPARPGPQRCGQDQPAAHPGRHDRGRPGRAHVGSSGHGRLLRPGARGHPCRRIAARPHGGGVPRPGRPGSPAPAGHVRPDRRQGAPGRGRPCRAARRPSSPCRCWSPGATTCCCSTSPPTTSTRRHARRWPPPWPAGAARW